MIIECKGCHARFRLDESKIRGKGARVKCRKCGEGIIVLRDEDTGIVSQEPAGEGSLDLGSILRESSGEVPAAPDTSSRNNLIPFPGSGKPPEAAEHQEKEEIDQAIDRLLAEKGEVPAFDPPAPAREEETPDFQSGRSPDPDTDPDANLTDAFASAPFEPDVPASSEPEYGVLPAANDFVAMPADAPPEFAPEEALELPPTPPEPFGPEDGSPPDPAEERFPFGDTDTLGFQNGRTGDPETLRDNDISYTISSAPIELDVPTPSEFETNALPAAADFVAPPPEDLPLEGNVTPQPAPREMDAPSSREYEPPVTVPPPAAPGPYLEPPPAPFPARGSASSRPLAAGAFLVMALLAAVGYFGFTSSGKKTVRDVAPRIAALFGKDGSAASGSRYEVKNVIGYFESGAASPRILVIKGQVTNLSKTGKSSIRVHAALLDNTEQVLGEKVVYAGNVLSGANLKGGSRDVLEKAFDNPLGERLSNMDVLPGKTVPFMVLFFDAPENIDSYRLEARDIE